MTNAPQIIALHSYGESFIGKRHQNEDSFALQEPEDPRIRAERGCLYIVCDGMGGHASGKVASSMAVEAVLQGYYSDTADNLSSLQGAIQQASTRVYAASCESNAYEEMGCTLVACLILADRAWVLHVGDSRAYRRRGESLERLTRDHRYVTEVLGLDEEAARDHPMKSRLSRAIGLQPETTIETAPVALEEGDQILLCSDGLTSVLPDERILALLTPSRPSEAVTRLLNSAQMLDVDDNTTALVITIGTKTVAPPYPGKPPKAFHPLLRFLQPRRP